MTSPGMIADITAALRSAEIRAIDMIRYQDALLIAEIEQRC